MTSRIAQYSARLIETGWLAAVIVVPLYFDVWSFRVFEPDKLALLRSIALVMLAAGLVYQWERGLPARAVVRGWLATPLVVPALAWVAAYTVATAASITPWLSLTGSYNRLQGLYTFTAYTVVFLGIVALVRDRDQLDRLVMAIILPSLPVALYGVVQKFGADPMPWLGDVTQRVASTLGNSIFVAAYLIMVVPLSIYKLIGAYRDVHDAEDGIPAYAGVLRLAGYFVLLFFQVLAIVLSQSRGPWLGLMGAAFFTVLMAVAIHGSRRMLLSLLGVGAVLAALLVVFNLPGSPLAPLRDVPYIGRLGRVLETERGTGKVRVLIWDGAVGLITSNPARMIVGWGPESMHWAYNPFYPPELGNYESRNASPDRSHNETFDALATTGILGFLAYLWFFTSVFYFGLKWLGMVAGAGDRNRFLALWIGGGVLAALGFQLWAGKATFLGVALPAGMIAGLFAFVVWQVLRGWAAPGRPGTLLMVGLLGGLIAHFIEIHFGIAIAATRTLCFAMAAALAVVGGLGEARPGLWAAEDVPPEARPPSATARPRRQRSAAGAVRPAAGGPSAVWGWAGAAFLVVTVLATLSFDFIVEANPATPKRLIMLWLMGLTWGIGSLLVVTETILGLVRAGRWGRGGGGALVYAGLTLGVTGVYAFSHRALLAQGGGADTSTAMVVMYYLMLGIMLAAWAWVLLQRDPEPGAFARRRAAWLYPLAGLAVIGLAFRSNIDEVRADIFYKEGWNGYHAASRYDEAVIDYDRALALDPREDYYLLFKGKALLEKADAEAQLFEERHAEAVGEPGFSEYSVSFRGDAANRDRLFEAALVVLEEARALAPRNTDHYANLGRAYQIWGDRTFDPDRRTERLGQSREWFLRAIAPDLSPSNAGLRAELATTEFLDGRTDDAMARIDEALAIDPLYTQPYRLRARIHRELEEWDAAKADYRAYVESREGRGDMAAWSELAFVLGQLKDLAGAEEANLKVVELTEARNGRPDPTSLANLALIARDLGQPDKACDYVERGLAVAPEDPELGQLNASLGCGIAPAPAGAPTTP